MSAPPTLYLSELMKNDEQPRFYQTSSFFLESQYTVLALQRSQGFIFNQDLFASPLQQQKAAMKEKRLRAQSFAGRRNLSMSWKRRFLSTSEDSESGTNSGANSVAPLAVSSVAHSRRSSFLQPVTLLQQRRHTSHEIRPGFRFDGAKYDDVIEDDSMDIEEEDPADMTDPDLESDEETLGGYKIGVIEVHVDPNDHSYIPRDR